MKSFMSRDDKFDQKYLDNIPNIIYDPERDIIHHAIYSVSDQIQINIKSYELMNYPEIRKQLCNNISVLEKIKQLILLSDNIYANKLMVAEYYEVDEDAIDSIIRRHKEELIDNGLLLLSGEELKNYKEQNFIQTNCQNDSKCEISKNTRSLYLFNRRVILNIGMLLRDSDIAKQIRNSLLNMSENPEAIKEEVYNLNNKINKLEGLLSQQKKMIDDQFMVLKYDHERLSDLYDIIKIKDSIIKVLLLTREGFSIDYLVQSKLITTEEYDLYVDFITKG